MLDLGNFFADSASRVERAMDELLTAEAIAPARLEEALRWSIFGGGKRFRPALMFAAGSVLEVGPAVLERTAAAVELIHTYSLVHDDLPAMDNDDLRRGRETSHKKFDEATAILAGDAMQALAFKAIVEDRGLPAEVRAELCSKLAAAAMNMVSGQQLDLEAEGRPASIDDVERIHRSKTGAIICFAVETPLIIADAGESAAAAFRSYGAGLGLLFQISDDILDVTGSTGTLGKTAAKDAASGKATYPSVLGLARARELAAEVLSATKRSLESFGPEADILRQIADATARRRA